MMYENLGRKIVIVGVSASGKSTFARKLAQKLNLSLTLMDEVMWKPGWEYIGDDTTVEKLRGLSSGSEWIIEGYITKKARTFLFERADTIIYLDYPRPVATWRYLKRWWTHRTVARPELGGSPDTFSFSFLKLVWTKGEAISLEKFLGEVEDQDKIMRFMSPREAQDFIAVVKV